MTQPEPDRPAEELPRFRARDIVGSSGRAEIELDGQIYELRITRSGKLILTK